ncbi:peroxiredoxin-like family protein [Psychroserpens algicola]|uniref:thioredoxin-dependent peroxiredoxin n=1 Tax=Psychroserpens algicola TaxID=1719034 RepID=A0ABT0H600_9FLAO|nr:peroxiredoxin-like family protein [Psychroserpens algicola]MCK8479804.1 AhpC/TSA family protein [Psychroserpens algicola]
MIKVKPIKLIAVFVFLSISSVNAQISEKPEDISPLLIGEKIPASNLINELGETISLNSQISKMNTVLVFYRGGWCPFCNLQLSGLATSTPDIVKLGYQVIAISPDDYKNIKPTIKKGTLNYKLYSDPKGKFIQQMGIAFTPDPRTKGYISKNTIGKATSVLPVPTVVVVNTKGEILFEYIAPNFKQRISSELLLAVLENL